MIVYSPFGFASHLFMSFGQADCEGISGADKNFWGKEFCIFFASMDNGISCPDCAERVVRPR